MIDFDGPNTTITLEPGGNTAIEIYSRWKEWVKLGNANFLEAFRLVGGDPLGGGLSAGSYYFLQNPYGWRIKPAETDGPSTITGNLFAEDAGIALFLGTLGNFNTSIRLQTSSLTQTVATGGASAITAQDKTDIAAEVKALLLGSETFP
jgi:hypothetical protein